MNCSAQGFHSAFIVPRSSFRLFSIFRQRLNEMVEAQPDAPAMMIEGDGKRDAEDEEDVEHQLKAGADEEQADDVDGYNQDLCGDDVDDDGTDKKAVLALKERAA
jgi:hypothetical protein